MAAVSIVLPTIEEVQHPTNYDLQLDSSSSVGDPHSGWDPARWPHQRVTHAPQIYPEATHNLEPCIQGASPLPHGQVLSISRAINDVQSTMCTLIQETHLRLCYVQRVQVVAHRYPHQEAW